MTGPKRFTTEAEIDHYMWQCVEIEPLVINEEFVRVPSDMAYWNERFASVFRHWKECKAKRERVWSERLFGLRRDLELESERKAAASLLTAPKFKLTVDMVEAAVHRDEQYQQAVDREIAAESEKVRLYGVLEAIRAKRDMLVSLGAQMRAELDALNLSVRQGHDND